MNEAMLQGQSRYTITHHGQCIVYHLSLGLHILCSNKTRGRCERSSGHLEHNNYRFSLVYPFLLISSSFHLLPRRRHLHLQPPRGHKLSYNFERFNLCNHIVVDIFEYFDEKTVGSRVEGSDVGREEVGEGRVEGGDRVNSSVVVSQGRVFCGECEALDYGFESVFPIIVCERFGIRSYDPFLWTVSVYSARAVVWNYSPVV